MSYDISHKPPLTMHSEPLHMRHITWPSHRDSHHTTEKTRTLPLSQLWVVQVKFP